MNTQQQTDARFPYLVTVTSLQTGAQVWQRAHISEPSFLTYKHWMDRDCAVTVTREHEPCRTA